MRLGQYVVATTVVFLCGAAGSGCSSNSRGGASEAGAAETDGSMGTGTEPPSDAGAASADASQSGVDAALPDIDGGARVVMLSPAQQATLCDWAVAEWGGYGTTVPCGGGINRTNPANQTDCVMGNEPTNPDCSLTVSQLETCILAAAPSG